MAAAHLPQMIIAGTLLTDAAVAELALVLHRAGEPDLGQYVGRAIDNGRDVLDLNRRDCEDILRVLGNHGEPRRAPRRPAPGDHGVPARRTRVALCGCVCGETARAHVPYAKRDAAPAPTYSGPRPTAAARPETPDRTRPGSARHDLTVEPPASQPLAHQILELHPRLAVARLQRRSSGPWYGSGRRRHARDPTAHRARSAHRSERNPLGRQQPSAPTSFRRTWCMCP